MNISQVNDLSYEDFIRSFGNVVEHCSICAAAVWPSRPFQDVHHLHREICCFIDDLPDSGKQGILRLHPDLAGKFAAQLEVLTPESMSEQKAAGLDVLNIKEEFFLKETSAKYREKFEFPFVICARQNKKEAILSEITKRIENPTATELSIGIEEVKKICFLRLLSIVSVDDNHAQIIINSSQPNTMNLFYENIHGPNEL